MDSSGKIIWARHNEVQTVNVKSLGSEYEVVDGERLPLAVKDLGACDVYPQVRPRQRREDFRHLKYAHMLPDTLGRGYEVLYAYYHGSCQSRTPQWFHTARL